MLNSLTITSTAFEEVFEAYLKNGKIGLTSIILAISSAVQHNINNKHGYENVHCSMDKNGNLILELPGGVLNNVVIQAEECRLIPLNYYQAMILSQYTVAKVCNELGHFANGTGSVDFQVLKHDVLMCMKAMSIPNKSLTSDMLVNEINTRQYDEKLFFCKRGTSTLIVLYHTTIYIDFRRVPANCVESLYQAFVFWVVGAMSIEDSDGDVWNRLERFLLGIAASWQNT